MDENCTPEFRCRNQTLTMEGRDGEIKAAPSAGLQVVGFVEQYATAPGDAGRRSLENPVSFQSKQRRRLAE